MLLDFFCLDSLAKLKSFVSIHLQKEKDKGAGPGGPGQLLFRKYRMRPFCQNWSSKGVDFYLSNKSVECGVGEMERQGEL